MNPIIHLLSSLLLPDFPSGSSINYHHERFYIIGDDATHILVLDRNYQKLDSIHLFDYAEKRIPKVDKTDLEGSVILNRDGISHLLIVGSASRKNRKRIMLIPFSDKGLDFRSQHNSFHKTKAFIKRIKAHNIDEVNLEGVCQVQGDLILGNRGNRSAQQNHLIVTTPDFWEHQDDAKLLIRELILPEAHRHEIVGLSELCYIPEKDLLLVTLTSEATDNAYADGEIGHSFIGWITGAKQKLQQETVLVDGMLNLAEADPIFRKEKVEGVCVESLQGSEMVLHLVSDNDAGESRLFKIKVTW